MRSNTKYLKTFINHKNDMPKLYVPDDPDNITFINMRLKKYRSAPQKTRTVPVPSTKPRRKSLPRSVPHRSTVSKRLRRY